MVLVFIQVSGDLSEIDISSEFQYFRIGIDITEEKQRNRLYELVMKMSEKEIFLGEDQEFEFKIEFENQKESLSFEDNSQSVQEELKKVRVLKLFVDSLVFVVGVGEVLYLFRGVLGF